MLKFEVFAKKQKGYVKTKNGETKIEMKNEVKAKIIA